MPRVRVEVTQNFEHNLVEIHGFLGVGNQAFEGLTTQLFDVVIPNLKKFPRMGVDFARRAALSVETTGLKARLARLTGTATEVREYIHGDYLVLYALAGAKVSLLAIRHHRQLSFDLASHWP